MNGWKRIGVVLSVIWALMVITYAIYEYSKFPLEPFTTYLSPPDSVTNEQAKNFYFVVIRGESGLEAKSSAELALYEELIRVAPTESDRQLQIAARDLTEYSSGVAWMTFLMSILLPVGLIWGLSLAGYRILLWIRKGFNNEQA
ncbi:MAG: hypothetical protein BVN34_06975 [Proteobacteria bacterium ST_bin12]|nr:MAG: hypothetical protein BVN34_06975 [Proteobacteria bacterium ST_bin12]